MGLSTESNEWMSDTVSDKGETALVGPPLALPWRRMIQRRRGLDQAGGFYGGGIQHQTLRIIKDAMTSTKRAPMSSFQSAFPNTQWGYLRDPSRATSARCYVEGMKNDRVHRCRRCQSSRGDRFPSGERRWGGRNRLSDVKCGRAPPIFWRFCGNFMGAKPAKASSGAAPLFGQSA